MPLRLNNFILKVNFFNICLNFMINLRQTGRGVIKFFFRKFNIEFLMKAININYRP